MHVLGTSKEVHTFWENSLWYVWMGIFASSSYQDSIFTDLACNCINSEMHRGKGSGSSHGNGGGVDVDVGRGRSPSPP